MGRRKKQLDEKAEAKENCPHCQGKRSWYDEKGKFHICACQMGGKGCICNLQEQALKGYWAFSDAGRLLYQDRES
jgi:hypothetical protein